jgi:hypothetical protein
MPGPKRLLKAFLCHAICAHIIPLWDADREPVCVLYNRLIKGGVDAYIS